MEEFLLLAMVFLLFGGITLASFLALVRRRTHLEQRLQGTVPGTDPNLGSNPELILGDLTQALSGQVPMTTEAKADLQRDLQQAGLYRPTALMEYAAVRAVLIIVPLIAGGVIALWMDTGREALQIWVGAILLALLGFSVPRIYLHWLARARRHAIERGLPTAVDMLTLCLGAGLNVRNSLQRVADELRIAYPVLAFELQLVRQQSELRNLEFALAQFAERVQLPSLRNVSVILNQSEKLGTEGIAVLREYADNMRVNMRQEAEALANRAPLKMMIPGYMMGAGFLILVITPPAMEIMAFRRDNILSTMQDEFRQALPSELNNQQARPDGTPAQPQQ